MAFWWRYLTDREFRLECEVEAYRVQLQLQPEGLFHLRLDQYAHRLATSYRLGISQDAARSLLLSS